MASIIVMGFLSVAAAFAQPVAFDQPVLLQDLEPGAAGSNIRFILPVHDRAVFLLIHDTGDTEELELWATDGTPGGTRLIQPDGLELRLESLNFWWTPEFLIFAGHDSDTGTRGVWRTDGSEAGTIKIAGNLVLDTPQPQPTGNGTVIFSARPLQDPTLDLWATDGTPGGTRQIAELGLVRNERPGFFYLEELRGEIYFIDTVPGESRVGLWRTDGTPAGTMLVSGPQGVSFQSVTATDSSLWLPAADDQDNTVSLWKSDGSSEGTALARELGPGLETSQLSFLIELPGDRALFRIQTADVPPSLWVSDGTEEGTLQLLEASSSTAISGVVERLGEHAYFTVNNDAASRDLWRTDGTPQGTELFFEGQNGPNGDLSFLISEVEDRLLLSVERPGLGFEPWITDGTPNSTRLLADVCPGPCFSNAYNWHETQGPVLFTAGTQDGPGQIFATDLTTAGTGQVTDFAGGVLRPFVRQGSSLGQQLLLGDRLLLTADDGTHGYELWALEIPDEVGPPPPPGPWLSSSSVPGFEYKVRIRGAGDPIAGSLEPTCIPETACISGALPGRSEVFIRIVGPRGNGFLWPTLVKFTTSEVEVWIRQTATGAIQYYRLEGARPGFDELPGLFDRTGFEPFAQ